MSYEFPPLPSQPEPSLSERLIEARKLRGTVSEGKFNHIMRAIHESARYFGDINTNIGSRSYVCPMEVSVSHIQSIVSKHFGLTVEELLSKRRSSHLVHARHIAIYLSKTLTTRSISEIARRFGGLEHSSAMHAVQKIRKMVEQDKTLARTVIELTEIIGRHEHVS